MIRVKPIELSARKWLRNSIRAYLEGQKDKRWIDGIVRGSETEAATMMSTEFGRFSGTIRYRELQQALMTETPKQTPETRTVEG